MECIVCYDKEKVFKIDCSHTYCLSCIQKIIEINPICAYCRKKLDLENILDKYSLNCSMIRRSEIFKIKLKIINEKATFYLTKMKDESKNTRNQIMYLEKLCHYLYENRYYCQTINKYRLLDTIIAKLKDFYFKQDIDESYEWYFKFREYRNSL